MINHPKHRSIQATMMLLAIGLLLTAPGCFKQMAQLMYVIKGHEVPAQYQGLEEKRIAFLCVSDESAYGPDALSYKIALHVGIKVANEGKEIQVISPQKIDQFIDENGWKSGDVVAMGKAVNADMVVVIELGSYSIHDGATLYKGQADLTTTVYDIEKDGQITFVNGPDEYIFPANGRPVMQTTERKFESFYLARLTDHIAHLFIPHDKFDTFAQDAIISN